MYFIYFDSWEHLIHLINNLNFNKHKEKILNLGKNHEKKVLADWRKILYS